MKIQKIASYKQPKYPQKEDVLRHPALLSAMPGRFRSVILPAAAVSGALMVLLTSCVDRRSVGSLPAPTYLLPEDEAVRIIRDELKKQGLECNDYPITIANVDIPYAEQLTSYGANDGYTYRKADLQVDGYNADKKIGYEFISQDDQKSWTSSNASVVLDSYADELSIQIKKADSQHTVGLFHSNPMNNLDAAEQHLRSDVDAFITWLKAQNLL